MRLEGTSLRVSLPIGWGTGHGKTGSLDVGEVLKYKGEPAFQISVKQSSKWPFNIHPITSLPLECDFMFDALGRQKNPDGRSLAALGPRPPYIPQDFYSRVLTVQSDKNKGSALAACLYLGSSSVTVMLQPLPGPQDESKITKMLQAIVIAGRDQSTLVYAPGKLRLPIMLVTASLDTGIWDAGKVSNGSGEIDLLVRTGGIAEAKITPMLHVGSCSTEMAQLIRQRKPLVASGTFRVRSRPPYVSSRWESTAVETVPPPASSEGLLTFVCRQLTESGTLGVVVAYDLPEIPQADALSIAQALDEIAKAALRGPNDNGVMYFPPSPLLMGAGH